MKQCVLTDDSTLHNACEGEGIQMDMPTSRNESPKRRRGVGRSLCSAFIATTMSVVLALSSVGGGALSAFAATISDDSANQRGAEANAVPAILPLSLRWVRKSTSNARPKKPLVPLPRNRHVKRRPPELPSNGPPRSAPLVSKPRRRLEPQPRPSKRPSRSKRLLPMRRRLRLR